MGQHIEPLNLRQKQKAETRDRVLSAARKLFEAQGYSAVTVRMISDEASVAVGSVFTAFDSKDDLLIAIICEDLGNWVPIVQRMLQDNKTAPLPARILSAFEPAIAYDVGHADKLREAMANSWTRTMEQEMQTRGALFPIVQALRDAIAAAKSAGQLGADADPAMLTDMVLHLYAGTIRCAAFDGWDVAKVGQVFQAQLQHVLR